MQSSRGHAAPRPHGLRVELNSWLGYASGTRAGRRSARSGQDGSGPSRSPPQFRTDSPKASPASESTRQRSAPRANHMRSTSSRRPPHRPTGEARTSSGTWGDEKDHERPDQVPQRQGSKRPTSSSTRIHQVNPHNSHWHASHVISSQSLTIQSISHILAGTPQCQSVDLSQGHQCCHAPAGPLPRARRRRRST